MALRRMESFGENALEETLGCFRAEYPIKKLPVEKKICNYFKEFGKINFCNIFSLFCDLN